jgi:hypothetical protein
MKYYLLTLIALLVSFESLKAQGNIAIQSPAPHQYLVSVTAATANVPYVLLGKLALTDATWSVISTQTTDANGNVSFLLAENTGGTGFFLSVSQSLDTDLDGIPNWWMLEYFGHADGQAGDNSLSSLSFLGDGISNLQKYIRGENPFLTPAVDAQNLINLSVFTPSN